MNGPLKRLPKRELFDCIEGLDRIGIGTRGASVLLDLNLRYVGSIRRLLNLRAQHASKGRETRDGLLDTLPAEMRSTVESLCKLTKLAAAA